MTTLVTSLCLSLCDLHSLCVRCVNHIETSTSSLASHTLQYQEKEGLVTTTCQDSDAPAFVLKRAVLPVVTPGIDEELFRIIIAMGVTC